MARVTSSNWRIKRKKSVKRASGFFGRANCQRIATRLTEKAMEYAYRDRRNKKRDFRSLWIQRINAASRICGTNYSQLMHVLRLANIELNKKMLSELAIRDMTAFQKIYNIAIAKTTTINA